jgi:DNA-directed RNA polymerase
MPFTEVHKMAEIIKNIALDIYPSLRLIYNYFMDTTRLTVKLNLPVVWFTPYGAIITQEYLKSIKEKVTLSYFGKNRSTIIRNWTDEINKNKQSQAIIPNIIHSLDASHLINVINKGNTLNIKPVISIHDCFGTHPNHMLSLSSVVRNEFVKLYSDQNFLTKYHSRVIESIKDNNYEIITSNNIDYVIYYIDDKKRKAIIPKLPNEGNLIIKDINKATYMIN